MLRPIQGRGFRTIKQDSFSFGVLSESTNLQWRLYLAIGASFQAGWKSISWYSPWLIWLRLNGISTDFSTESTNVSHLRKHFFCLLRANHGFSRSLVGWVLSLLDSQKTDIPRPHWSWAGGEGGGGALALQLASKHFSSKRLNLCGCNKSQSTVFIRTPRNTRRCERITSLAI